MWVCLSWARRVFALSVSVPVRVDLHLWVSLLGFLKSGPSVPELPDGEYTQIFHLAYRGWADLHVSRVNGLHSAPWVQ